MDQWIREEKGISHHLWHHRQHTHLPQSQHQHQPQHKHVADNEEDNFNKKRKSRKRALTDNSNLFGGLALQWEPNKGHLYREVNHVKTLPVCPYSKFKMSEQGDKGYLGPGSNSAVPFAPVRVPLLEEEDNDDSNFNGEARHSERLDLGIGAESASSGVTCQVPAQHDNQIINEDDISTHQLLLDMFKSCRLQYEKTPPLKIVRASQQFMYDDADTRYMDCVNSVAHVGHCHPAIVEAISYTLGNSMTTCGWPVDYGDLCYPSKLQQTLPNGFDTFLFCNSGSEAVDLSIQLARLYTCGTDAIVVDNAFHGSIDSVYPLSPKVSKEASDWVHVIPMPDLYRGSYQKDDPTAIEKYLSDTREIIERAQGIGKKIACCITEPMLTIPGCIMPPGMWLQELYKMVREVGGLCIADEVQTGLGRIGSHFWSFEAQNVVPDIIVIGKQIGNGYPMAVVVTSRDIAAVLGERVREYQCTNTMDAVGCTVLDVVHREQLMSNAANVGRILMDQLIILKRKHEYIGDVRGKGLMIGIEIVWSKSSKKPSQEIAEQIVYRMKEENVLLANEGNNRNILILIPPMCFSQENALSLAQKLDKVLTELPNISVMKNHITGLPTLTSQPTVGTRDVRLGIFQPQEEDDDDNSMSQQDSMDLDYAQHCYQDLD